MVILIPFQMCAGDDNQQTNYRWPNALKVSKQTRSKQEIYIYKSFTHYLQCINFNVVLNTQVIHVMLYAIWYQLNNLKNMKNTHGGMLLFKLYKWYQILQNVSYVDGYLPVSRTDIPLMR